MNLQRIAELTIDVANHFIKSKKLGLPQHSADAFVLLHRAHLISADTLKKMRGMVGFRDLVVHEYQQMDLSLMVDVIEHHLRDPLDFVDMVLQATVLLRV